MADYESVGVMFKWVGVFVIGLSAILWLMAGGWSKHLVTCYDKGGAVIGKAHYQMLIVSPDDGSCAYTSATPGDYEIHHCARCEEK